MGKHLATYVVDHPHAKGHLEEVVDHQGLFQSEWFAILHVLGTP